MEKEFQHYRREIERRLKEYERRLRECERRIRSLQRQIPTAEGEEEAITRRMLDELQERYERAKAAVERGLEQLEHALSEGKEVIEAGLTTVGEVGTRSAVRALGLLKTTYISVRAVGKGLEAGFKAAREARRGRE